MATIRDTMGYKDCVRISRNSLWAAGFVDLEQQPIVYSQPDTMGAPSSCGRERLGWELRCDRCCCDGFGHAPSMSSLEISSPKPAI